MKHCRSTLLTLVAVALQTTTAFQPHTTIQLNHANLCNKPSTWRLTQRNKIHPSNKVTNAPCIPLRMSGDSNKIEKRKKRVVIGYQATSLLYLASGFAGGAAYASSGASLPRALLLASAPIHASGLAYIMSDAAANDRLSSDTYKRLAIVLAKYGAAGLIVAGLLPPIRKPLWVASSLLALINGIKGYGYGILGLDKNNGASVVQETKGLIKSSLGVLFSSPKNVKSAWFMACTWMYLTWMACIFVKAVEVLRQVATSSSSELNWLATYVARLARMKLLAVTTLVLKDAADRDRLEGSTFIKLNGLSCLSLAAMAGYYTTQQAGTTSMALGGASAFFSVFAAFNAGASIIKKKN